MAKYAIYKITYLGIGSVIKYGLPPNNTEISEIEIMEEYENYKICSSEYHAGMRALKKLQSLLNRAMNNHAGPDVVAALKSFADGDGWPQTPFVDMAFQRLSAAEMVLVGAERAVGLLQIAIVRDRAQRRQAEQMETRARLGEKEAEARIDRSEDDAALREQMRQLGYTPRH